MDAFACPSLKKTQQKTTKQLREAREYIDDMKTSYQSLEEKLSEREAYFNKRECELHEFHRIEMNKGERINFLNFNGFCRIKNFLLKS